MNLDELKSYIEFMDEHNLSELEIEVAGKRVKLKKDSGGQSYILPQMMQQNVPAQLAEKSETKNEREGLIEIKSPMVGTFYRASSPGAKSYVDVGQKVKSGDVVCILEAMKLMNEIKAEISGKIAEILVENGSPVEYGQTLFVVDPE
ncbi:MAG: acetyl-CoA carboxylase biotin carboxyl carrier protein [Candidatus Omnitrophica bacterium]|nr:acetyl-CoA carboxylase biotin carboxyl carrier protein [Candidatus Omnitrophota bacterium]